MGHGKETPRQKMIGMMYLVLTAMLALNVSKDILNGFVIVNNGLVQTTSNFVAKNLSSYEIFDAEMEKSEAKVKPFRDNAYEVKKQADDLTFEVQELKIEMLKFVDGEKSPSLIPNGYSIGGHTTYEIDGTLIGAKDNYDKPSQMMILEGKGDALKKKIEKYKEFLVSLTDNEGVKKGILDALNTEDEKNREGITETWESLKFSHMPLVAALAMLSKVQGDVRNAEADIINDLLSQIGATDTKVNKMEAIVQSLKPSYVLVGGEYQARILLAAYDSLQKPEIYLGQYQRDAVGDYVIPDGGVLLPYDERGRAIFKVTGTSVGEYKRPGLLQMFTPEGKKNYPFTIEYTVGQSNTVISPTKMNVLYIGVDNPISVSMSGVPMERIKVAISNGNINKVGNEWIANPSSPGAATITATAEVDGNTKRGEMPFRVKVVPNPVPKVGGRIGGKIDKATLMAQVAVVAELEAFDFDMKFNVTGFSVSAVVKGFNQTKLSTSARFTEEQKSLVNSLTKGTKVYIEDIKAVGPDKRVRDLPVIAFTID